MTLESMKINDLSELNFPAKIGVKSSNNILRYMAVKCHPWIFLTPSLAQELYHQTLRFNLVREGQKFKKVSTKRNAFLRPPC